MSEPTTLAGDLDGDLRRYFAVTTSTDLPRRVAEMSARTLGAERRPLGTLLMGAGGLAAAVLLVFLVANHSGPLGTSNSALSTRGGAGAVASPGADFGPGLVAYPGVDTGRLAISGTRLLVPSGHGPAVISPAQALATASSGAKAEAPAGPAVLAFVVFAHAPQSSCLCWVVDVPVRGGVANHQLGLPPTRTELVLVDAVDGRVAVVLTGNGVP